MTDAVPAGVVPSGVVPAGVVPAGAGHVLTARGSVMAFKAVAAQTGRPGSRTRPDVALRHGPRLGA